MIEKILFYPDLHEDLEVEKTIASSILNDFEKKLIDSVFFETSYSWNNLLKTRNGRSVIPLLPKEIPLFGVEHKPYHDAHINAAKIAVLTYKAIKEGISQSCEKTTEVMVAIREASKNRMKALTQNLLLKCFEKNYERPAFVCGGNHFSELKDLFEKRGHLLELCNSYANLLNSKRKRGDYAIRKFSVPLIEYHKI